MNDEFCLVMASILHDVGKIEQRVEKNKKHAELGKRFFDSEITSIDRNDKELISKLIGYHHHHANETDLDEQGKYLLNILKEADARSAAHDREDKEEGIKDVRLYKISDLLCNGKDKNCYTLSTLDSIEDRSINDGYKYILNTLKSDLQKLDFNRDRNQYDVFNSLNSVLYKDTVFVPSAFYYSEPNISLYHHLKLTAAIALSMYRYEKQDIELRKTRDTNNSFILLLCNLSGLQPYIFRAYKSDSADDKGTKRLKGRSLMIKITTDSIESYLLNELNLYRFNIVWEKSDGFLMLFENTEDNQKKLKELKKDIELEMIDKKRGLYANISWATANLGNFETVKDLENDKNNDPFGSKMIELYNNLDKEKREKYLDIITDDKIEFTKKFGESIIDMCENCGLDSIYKNEKLFPTYEPDNSMNGETGSGSCVGCLEEEYVGTSLYKYKYLILNISASSIYKENKIKFKYGNKTLGYYFSNKIEGETISINDFGISGNNWRFMFQAKNVVLNDNKTVKPINELFEKEDKKDGHGSESLQIPINEPSEKEYNKTEKHKMLGIFKADVDNMGTIIATDLNKITISRLASLSFEFEYFFSIKLDKIAKENRVYIIYSGGDDVSAMGKIDDVINFIYQFHDEFNTYFSNNIITISAGIAITSPSFPLRRGINIAEENLGEAKSGNKNKINFFDIMPWNIYKELTNLGDEIYKKISNNNLSKGFPYFLYNLGNMYNKGISKGTVITSSTGYGNKSIVIPDPLLYYYITRNYNVDNLHKYEVDEFIELLLPGFKGIKKSKLGNDEIWKNMNFLSSYVVIKLRSIGD